MIKAVLRRIRVLFEPAKLLTSTAAKQWFENPLCYCPRFCFYKMTVNLHEAFYIFKKLLHSLERPFQKLQNIEEDMSMYFHVNNQGSSLAIIDQGH